MIKNLIVLLLFSVLLASCNNEVTENPIDFIQPEVLNAHSHFDLDKVTFKENAHKLLGNAIDTPDVYHELDEKDPFIVPRHYSMPGLKADKRFIAVQDHRFYRTIEMDSVARFKNIFFDRVAIETDTTGTMTAILGYSKFKEVDKSRLDSVLMDIYKKYGLSTEMKEVKNSYGQTPILTVYDSAGVQVQKETFVDPDVDYKGYLLEYSDGDFMEWKLNDKVIQIGITQDREIGMSTEPSENYNIPYYYVELLILPVAEYNRLEAQIWEASEKADYPVQIVKSYTVESLNFYDHYDRYLELKRDRGLNNEDY